MLLYLQIFIEQEFGMKPFLWFFVLAFLDSGLALAQQTAGSSDQSAALEQKIRDLEDRVIALEGKDAIAIAIQGQ